jgi:sulfatase maturation enzyme AslB (radical SAM superfamily)
MFISRRFIFQKTFVRYYLLKTRGKELAIELTDRCNLKCAYCPKSVGIGGRGGVCEWGGLN